MTSFIGGLVQFYIARTDMTHVAALRILTGRVGWCVRSKPMQLDMSCSTCTSIVCSFQCLKYKNELSITIFFFNFVSYNKYWFELININGSSYYTDYVPTFRHWLVKSRTCVEHGDMVCTSSIGPITPTWLLLFVSCLKLFFLMTKYCTIGFWWSHFRAGHSRWGILQR